MAAAHAGGGASLASIATQGAFAQLGKVKGAAYWLLRLAISNLLEDPQEPSEVMQGFPDCYPFFSRLSLSQRLALMAELAEGLLCRDAPLPPDTLQHHAAMLFLFQFIQEKLDLELDMDAVEGVAEETEVGSLWQEQGGRSDGVDDDGLGDLGELEEDGSAELAAALRAAAAAAQAAEEAAAAAAAAPTSAGGTAQPAAAANQDAAGPASGLRVDEFMQRLLRETALRQRREKHSRKRAARVAAGMQALSDAQLLEEVSRGPSSCAFSPEDMLSACFRIIQLTVQPAGRGGPPSSPAALEVIRESQDPRLLRRRLARAEEVTLTTGPVTWRQLFCAYLQQRYPQLTQLDPSRLDSPTCQLFTSLKYGLGPCLLLSDAERALQFGCYDDTDSERHEVARTLLIDRFVQQATEEFQQGWTEDQDMLNARLLHVTCPAAGWFTFPNLTPQHYPMVLRYAEEAKLKQRKYMEAQTRAGEDLQGWKERERSLRVCVEELEEYSWMRDWHKVVRKLPGSYASLSARLQAVRRVHPRHSLAAMVSGRPSWMGDQPPLASIAKQRQEERARNCSHAKCHRLEAAGESFKCCGKCRTAVYCSVECQRADWARHKIDCARMEAEWQAGE